MIPARLTARTGRGRRSRSRFLSGLLLAALLGLVMLVGFLFGRFVIGEAYLRQTFAPAAVASQPQAPASVPAPRPPPAPVSIPPLEEEPAASSPFDVEEWPPSMEETPGPGPEALEGGAASRESGRASEDEQPAPPPTKFAVQVGIFRRQDSAEALAGELRQTGHSARVIELAGGAEETRSYRVVCGRYETEAAARTAADALKDQGYEAFIVRAP